MYICMRLDCVTRFCSRSNSSLQKAIENIEQHYLVVGLYEDLPAYLEILEYLMPHVFSGISQLYPEIGNIFLYYRLYALHCCVNCRQLQGRVQDLFWVGWGSGL